MLSVIVNWLNENISDIPILAIVISAVLYIVFSALGLLNIVYANYLLLALLAALSWRILSITQKMKNAFIKIDTTFAYQNKNNEKITGKISKISDDVLSLVNEDTAFIDEFDNLEEFYDSLEKKEIAASKRVWLMHLDPWPPTSSKCNSRGRVDYFDNILKIVKGKDEIEVKRIINIPNLEKLEWVENLVKETDQRDNFHLAYINVKNIEYFFPTTISCQIIDEDKIFLLNPLLNHIPRTSFKKCVYIENRKVTAIYEDYYERLWSELENENCAFGCIIKGGKGTDLFDNNLQRIKNDINKRSDQHTIADIVSVNVPTITHPIK